MSSAMTDGPAGEDLPAIYRNRFDERELAGKRILWEVLVRDVFQRYVPPEGTVVDLGAGRCEFVNAVAAGRRIAVDLNPDTATHAAVGVEVLTTRSDDLGALPDGVVDTVFTSNFFEHLPTKADLMSTLRECHRVTRPGGRLVVLMPNIRHLPGRYWDYLDHHLPLTDLSVAEALELTGYRVEERIGRFLPYTIKDARFEVRPFMVRGYLRCRPAWRVLGKQMLVVGRRA
ncbi:MAG: methyltransferase domain-containing protein [Nocardioides sp.]|nr:methyltransferase domain-containing protein [Nocardioides sp.]